MFEVSVIIPVYNAEKFVKKAVESALQQEEVREIILVEDASPDDALVVCKELQNRYDKIKLLQHPDKKNHGAGASRNLGIINASCEYIAFLDADDQYLAGRFKTDKEIFFSDPLVEGVYNACVPYALDKEGEIKIGKGDPALLTMNAPFNATQLFENISPIGEGGFFFLNTLTVKKEVFEKTGLMNPALRLSQDTDITIKIAALCNLVPGNLVVPVALYGMHEENRSHNADLLISNRPYLFYELYKWGLQKKIKRSRICLLWQRFYEYNMILKRPTRKDQIRLLMGDALRNPGLIFSRFYLKQLPILSRLIK